MKGISCKLADHMGGDIRVYEAAKATMGDEISEEVRKELDPTRLIKFLAREKHVTPFRHPQVTLQCEAPIFVARQLGKHQVGFSWNERSMRYRDSIINFFFPEEWRERPDSLHDGSAGVHMDTVLIDKDYVEFIKTCSDYYQHLINSNVAPEQARMVLPQSMITRWVWTGSLWGWFEVYRQRASNHAQEEVRDFAHQLDEIMSEAFPIAWNALKETITE